MDLNNLILFFFLIGFNLFFYKYFLSIIYKYNSNFLFDDQFRKRQAFHDCRRTYSKWMPDWFNGNRVEATLAELEIASLGDAFTFSSSTLPSATVGTGLGIGGGSGCKGFPPADAGELLGSFG